MKKYILLLAITLVSVHTWAQENRTKTLINAALHGWEYELKAGFNWRNITFAFSRRNTQHQKL